MDDFFTRFSEDAGLLCILTRWHIDDPIGRLISAMPDIKVLSYSAIAKEDEPNRKIGDPLFPEHKSYDFLMERKNAMYSGHWEALYQQNPIIEGGELIRRSWFRSFVTPPLIKYRKIFADTAMKTAERNDYSVFACWGLGDDGKMYLLDLLKGKWEAPELKRVAKAFWQKHNNMTAGQLRQFLVEDKASGTGLIQEIKREGNIPVKGVERTKDKLTRLLDVLSYIEAGLVCIPESASFTNDFLAECESFTSDDTHMHDDQVDTMIDAINDMLANNKLKAWENF
jgi:predicted phage terminase large subunit-like protein